MLLAPLTFAPALPVCAHLHRIPGFPSYVSYCKREREYFLVGRNSVDLPELEPRNHLTTLPSLYIFVEHSI